MYSSMWRGSGNGGGGSVDYNRVVEKISVIPAAETATVGKVYMYIGETNTTYTHGYIYECVATQTASDVSFSGNIITSWAVADFVSYLQEGGSAYNEVTHGSLTYDESGGLWDLVGYDANGLVVMSFHEYTEDLEDFGCVFASSTHQDGDNCNFTMTTEQSGKKWKRLDVQPAGGSGGGAVDSVNGQIGAVVLDAEDVGAVPQYSTMPTATAEITGNIVQFTGTTNANYTNGYFYKCAETGSSIVSGTATVTEYINANGETPDQEYMPTFVFDKTVFDAYVLSQGEPENTGTSITFTWESDDETGDTLLVAHYNTNDSVSTILIDEQGEPLNQTYAIFGFTTNFADPTEDPEAAEQQWMNTDGHITITLPTVSSYAWERVDTQPAPVIPDPLPSQTDNAGKFLTTNGTEASWGTVINDNSTTSLTETWSASKLNTMIGNVETLLSQI